MSYIKNYLMNGGNKTKKMLIIIIMYLKEKKL